MLNKTVDFVLSALGTIVGTFFVLFVITPIWLIGIFITGLLEGIGNFLNRRFHD